MKNFIAGYIACLLWLLTDENGGEIRDAYADHISPESMDKIRRECADFYNANRETLERGGWSDEQAGHDFYLTRNRHGAGFWDREWNDETRSVRTRLTDNAHAYGETYDSAEKQPDGTYIVYSE
jgi:hypothetical protein